MSITRSGVVVLCALVLGAGCVNDPDPEVQTTAAQVKAPCEDVFCGNTSNVVGYPFWELDLTMASYSPVGGFRIKSMTGVLGAALKPEVLGFNLVGRRADNVMVMVPNFKMQLEADTGEVYELTFATSNGFHYYENGKEPGDSLKPTYLIKYRRVDGAWAHRAQPLQDLCVKQPGVTVDRESIVFRGDRYDPSSGTVTATGVATGTWFNLACQGDAMWKLAVMRYVEAAKDATHFTSQEERTTALRSIRADYCGTGKSFTELGTDVDWESTRGWLTLDAAIYPRVEAIWSKDGAVCLDYKRIATKVVVCPQTLNPCTTIVGDWKSHGFFYTHVP